jgi:hypothetical protein
MASSSADKEILFVLNNVSGMGMKCRLEMLVAFVSQNSDTIFAYQGGGAGTWTPSTPRPEQ